MKQLLLQSLKLILVSLVLFNIALPLLAAPNSANLWVDANGGSCTRQSSAGAYSDTGACASIDAAWDAASVGDIIVIKAGAYGPQTITGNKTSPGVTIYGEPTTTIGALNTNAAYMTLQDVTVDIGNGARNTGWTTGADNVTLRNVKLHGSYFVATIDNNNVTWDGGEFGVPGQTGAPRVCGVDGEPVQIYGANNVTIDGVQFYKQGADLTPSGCSSNGFHLEYIRVDLGGSNFRLRNSIFYSGDASNTATVFVTNPTGGSSYNGLKFENNMFGENDASSGALSVHANVSTCSNWTFAYNTYRAYPGAFAGNGGVGCGTNSGWLWVGNLGVYASSSPCVGTHTKNVWQYSQAGSCGTDRWVIGTQWSTNALGLGGGDGFRLQAGSVAIDAAETAGYCTSNLGKVDVDGNPRPVGSACDAGANEFGSSIISATPPNPPTSLQVLVR